ncbi:MAG: YihY/virulence factor BrkB family protein [Candidatus Rokuibacteriota bacterium]|nr:MAG: YihY/virulence factor BrkB family protein [Candidatus Rokubacteria bacterium]
MSVQLTRSLGIPPGPESGPASPWNLGGLSLPTLARRVYHEIDEDEIFDRAAALAYYFLFALFPTLLFLTTLFGMLPVPGLIDRMMAYLQDVLPGDSASMMQKTLGEIVRGARGRLLSIGALAALWAASAGVSSMISALDITYEVSDPRPWWRRRLLAIGLTLALSLLALVAMVLLVFGGTIGSLLGNRIGFGGVAVAIWNVVQWPVAVFCVVFGVALVYYTAPAVRQRWYWITPGSLFATFAWVTMSIGLRLYVEYFGNYNATYGSIGGVILLLLWLYLTSAVLLIGAEINSEIEAAAARRGAETAKAAGERVDPRARRSA